MHKSIISYRNRQEDEFIMRKYLEDIGIKHEDTPQGWNLGDNREVYWEEQRGKYGFDERETWSLDYAFKLWLYERLSLYNDIDKGVDMSFHKFEYEGNTLTLQECIDLMLEGLKLSLTASVYDKKNEEISDKIDNVLPLFYKCSDHLWW